MPPQKTSFEPHARQPDSFRKPRQGDLILFSQISSIRNEGRHEVIVGIRLGVAHHLADNARVFDVKLDADDLSMIEMVLAKSRDLITLIGDCGDEYRS